MNFDERLDEMIKLYEPATYGYEVAAYWFYYYAKKSHQQPPPPSFAWILAHPENADNLDRMIYWSMEMHRLQH
jgi:hypothetical protein